MKISTNMAAINAQRNLVGNQRNIQKSFAQLASGNRINKASDDAAGLAISENLSAQIRSARQARSNANNGISLIQTAEGALNEIGNIVVRLRELGMQAASDTVSEVERSYINKEVTQLKDEIDRIALSTTWGKNKLLDGSSPKFDFQIGIYNDDFADRISFDSSANIATIDALDLNGLDYTTKDGAQNSLESLDSAQQHVNNIRANLGALQNRLTSTVDNLAVTEENMQSAKSRIKDADIAQTTADLTKNNILLQATTSTLAQANQNTALALKLIG